MALKQKMQTLAMKTRKCKCCGKKFENRISGGNYCMECTSEALKIDKIKGIKNENNLQKKLDFSNES